MSAEPIGPSIGELLRTARSAMRPISVKQCGHAERMRLAANIAEALRGEIGLAYGEQTSRVLALAGCAPQYRLTSDDVVFATRWSRWLRYQADLAEWSLVPEHKAALAVEASVPERDVVRLPADVRAVLDTRPAPVPEARLGSSPDGWPSTIVDWSWSATFAWIVRERSIMAGKLPLEAEPVEAREPGDDDPDAGGEP